MKKGGQYAKGASWERAIVKYLVKHKGAYWAARTAGSHSSVDVAADFKLFTLRVQAKSGEKASDSREFEKAREEMKEMSSHVASVCQAWAINDRGRILICTFVNGSAMDTTWMSELDERALRKYK